MRCTSLAFAFLLSVAACGGSRPAATSATTDPAPATEPPAEPATTTGAPAIGPDECCCPFASAEGVAFNVSPRADCEAAGSECVEADRCGS